MKLTAINCPNCGGKVHIEEGRTLIYCSYCGTQIHIDDGTIRIELKQHYIDEAKMRELELQEKQRIREEQARLEEEKRRAEEQAAEAAKEQKRRKRWLITAGVWILFGVILLLIGAANYNKENIMNTIFVFWIMSLLCIPVILSATIPKSFNKGEAYSIGGKIGLYFVFVISGEILMIIVAEIICVIFGIDITNT